MAAPRSFKYVSTKRRVREDRRFVAGRGNFVAGVTPPGTLHAAVLTSPYACARMLHRPAEPAMPGGLVVVGDESSDAVDRCCLLDAPLVKRYPRLSGVRATRGIVCRRGGGSRRLAEERERKFGDYQPAPFILAGEAAYAPASTPRHPAWLQVLSTWLFFFRLGEFGAFAARSTLSRTRAMGRSATVRSDLRCRQASIRGAACSTFASIQCRIRRSDRARARCN